MVKKLFNRIVFVTAPLVMFCLFGCKVMNTAINRAKSEEEAIIKIAQDTAIKVYGYDKIQHEFPLVAELRNDSIWVVDGTLPKGMLGGTVHVEVLRKNKKVIQVTHYK